MPDRDRRQLTDAMLREAVRQELDSVESPPVEQVWGRIQARLAGPRSGFAAPPPRRITWGRLSAVAAVLLVFFLGGLGAYRVFDQGGFRFLSQGFDESPFLSASEDCDGRAVPADEPALEALEEWPPPAINGFSFTQLSELETGMRAARYTRGTEVLFWARMEETHPPPGLELFVDSLQEGIGLPVAITGEENGLLYLSVGDNPGLAWRAAADGSAQALWDSTGALTPEALREFLERIYQ